VEIYYFNVVRKTFNKNNKTEKKRFNKNCIWKKVLIKAVFLIKHVFRKKEKK